MATATLLPATPSKAPDIILKAILKGKIIGWLKDPTNVKSFGEHYRAATVELCSDLYANKLDVIFGPDEMDYFPRNDNPQNYWNGCGHKGRHSIVLEQIMSAGCSDRMIDVVPIYAQSLLHIYTSNVYVLRDPERARVLMNQRIEPALAV